MNWSNKLESTTDLLLVLGTGMIVIGFCEIFRVSGWQLVLAGLIVILIGAPAALKRIKKEKRRK